MTRFAPVVLLACFVLLTGCSKPGPGDRVEALARAMADGDKETAGEIVPGMPAMLGNEKFGKMVEEAADDAEDKGGLESVTIDKEEVDGDTATVTATITWGNGETDTDDFILEKQDGEWIVTLGDEKPQPEFDMQEMPEPTPEDEPADATP